MSRLLFLVLLCVGQVYQESTNLADLVTTTSRPILNRPDVKESTAGRNTTVDDPTSTASKLVILKKGIQTLPAENSTITETVSSVFHHVFSPARENFPVEERFMTPPFVMPEFHPVQCRSCLPPLKRGGDLFLGMTEWNHLVCGESVCNPEYNKEPCGNRDCEKCHCDDDCVKFGDCCPDMLLTREPEEPDAMFSCISQAFVESTEITSTKYKMVASCPITGLSSAEKIKIANLCHNPDPQSVEENTPVYSPQTRLNYRNTYCAQCHSVTDTQPWWFKPFCQQWLDFSRVSSRQELLQMLRDEKHCAAHFYPPLLAEVRECSFAYKNSIKTCNVTGLWTDYDPDVELACSLYSQPLVDGNQTYDNIFCGYCNGLFLSADRRCRYPITEPKVIPFSMLLDLPEETTQAQANDSWCSDEEVYDPYIDSCRPLFCSSGKYLKNHTCVSLFQSAEGLGYILHFTLKPRNKDFIFVRSFYNFRNTLDEHINEHVGLLEPKLQALSINVTFRTQKDLAEVWSLDIQLSILVGSVIPRQEAESRLIGLMSRSWWFYETASPTPLYFDFVWHRDVSNERLNNPSYPPDIAGREPFGTIRTELFSSGSRHYVDIPSIFFTNTSAYILISELMVCDLIELNTTEFTVVDNRTIVVSFNNNTLREGQFLWNNGKVRICSNFTGQKQITEQDSKFDETEVTLTLVCTSFSLCGLAVTVGIYLIVPGLRTLPGRNNVCLFVNLFVAQLLFLTGSGAKVSVGVCRLLGIIIHYFWLSTFCWKVVCAFHMYRIFANPLKRLDEKKSLLKYIFFSQLSPCVIICLVIFVNFGISDMTKVGYGDRKDMCFLSSSLDLIIGFLSPVALVIVINTYFFSRVVRELRSSSHVQRHGSKRDAKKSILYLKMSLVLGFTWILGFIAIAADERGMWYVFTVVNASMGVFVFLSFGLKNLSLAPLLRGREANSVSKTYETTVNTSVLDKRFELSGKESPRLKRDKTMGNMENGKTIE